MFPRSDFYKNCHAIRSSSLELRTQILRKSIFGVFCNLFSKIKMLVKSASFFVPIFNDTMSDLAVYFDDTASNIF